MGRRRIEMHEYRNVLIRLRAGDGDREIARLGLMGRVKVASFREHARSLGWLEVDLSLPDTHVIAQSLVAVTVASILIILADGSSTSKLVNLQDADYYRALQLREQ